MAGTLARENAPRNPRRTSATASALMIGVGLVVLITVFAASARASVSSSIDKAMKSEYIVDTKFGMGGLSPTVAQRIDALPEIAAVTPLRYVSATVNNSTKDVTAFDPATVDADRQLRRAATARSRRWVCTKLRCSPRMPRRTTCTSATRST